MGEKVWVGGDKDTPVKGGVVLDLNRNVRVAAPPAGKDVVDAPAGAATAEIVAPAAGQPARQVSVTIAGQKKNHHASGRATRDCCGLPAWETGVGCGSGADSGRRTP